MFDSSSLKKKVEESLNDNNIHIPDGHKAAFVSHVDDEGNVQVVFAAKVNKQWQISSNFQYMSGKDDKITAGVRIVRTW